LTDFVKKSVLFVCLAAIFTSIALFIPIPRQIGLIFRQDLFILPLLFVLAWITVSLKNSYLKIIFFAALFLICILPLSGLWNSGMSDQFILAGSIPWSDGFILYNHTMQFMFGQAMGATTALRPISVTFYALVLYLTNNNFILLYALIAILTALTVLWAVNSVNQYFGSVAAAFFYCNAFFYFRSHLGEYLTENYGFILGMFACNLLLKGLFEKRANLTIFGFLIFSTALNARPGPMLVYPLVILWFIFSYSKSFPNRLRLILAFLAALAGGFVINAWNTFQTYGSLDVPNRLVAEIVYGLCNGGQPWYFSINRPEIIALADSKNALLDVAGLCAGILRDNPSNLLLAGQKVVSTLLFDAQKGLFSYFDGTAMTWLVTLVRGGLIGLWIVGIIIAMRKDKSRVYGLLTALAFGFILTQFIVPPFTTYQMRYDASSIWFHGILIGIFPQVLINRFNGVTFWQLPKSAAEQKTSNIVVTFSSLLIALAVFSPWFLKQNPLPIPAISKSACEADEDRLLLKIDEGSYIYMQEESSLEQDHYPTYRLAFVREKIHNIAHAEIFEFTDSIDKPTAIIRGLDLETFQDALVFSPLELVAGQTGYVQFCGSFIDPPILNNDRFFIPVSATFIE